MPLYSEKNNLVFVHIYKTGGTSTRMLLKEHFTDLSTVDDEHSSYADLIKHHPELKNAFSFSIVRCPYDWLVSLYCYITGEKEHRDHSEIVDKSFSEFLIWMRNKMKEKRNDKQVFYGQQSEFICDKKGIVLIDKMIQFEHLRLSLKMLFWEKFRKKISEIPHLTKSKRNSEWRYYYTNDDLKLVNDLFDNDFKICGYQKIDVL